MKFKPTPFGWLRIAVVVIVGVLLLIPVHVAEKDRGTNPTRVEVVGGSGEYGHWGVAGILSVDENGNIPLGTRLIAKSEWLTRTVTASREKLFPDPASLDAASSGDIRYSNEVADLIAMGVVRGLLGEDPGPVGWFVTETTPTCSWFTQGLQERDVIVSHTTQMELFEANSSLSSRKVDSIAVDVVRNGQLVELQFTSPCVGFPLMVESYAMPGMSAITPGSTGSSRGLMVTLAMLDAATAGDLTGGLKITGTGEIVLDGSTGPIDGADAKVIGAHNAGFDVFIVDADDYPEALASARSVNSPIEVVSAATAEEALLWLCSNTGKLDAACSSK